ncbi:MAG: hypothetical protein ABJA79_00340 [Parafilimonas sp.]
MITRNNYEEYFLLYTDDELNAQQRSEVELFAAENTDLAQELKLLQQLRAVPDEEIIFDDKASLFKSDVLDDIALNYEEYFLLFIDNELTEAQKSEVEKFVLHHPQYQETFTLLKQTVLPREQIEFTNKETLYKYTETVKRIVPFNFMRIAAAAAFIGAGILFWWLLNAPAHPLQIAKNKTEQQDKQQKQALKQPDANSASSQKQKNELANIKPDEAKELQPMNKSQAAKNSSAKNNISASNQKWSDPGRSDHVDQGQPVPQRRKSDHKYADTEFLITHERPSIIKQKNIQEEDIQAPPQPSLNNKNNIDNNKSVPAQNDIALNNNNKNENYTATPIVYKEINTAEDDRSFYVGNLNLNKDKVKSLLKKAVKLFGDKARNYANDDGKLQVANLQFNENK